MRKQSSSWDLKNRLVEEVATVFLTQGRTLGRPRGGKHTWSLRENVQNDQNREYVVPVREKEAWEVGGGR